MVIFATVSDTVRVGIVLDLETGATNEVACRPEFSDPTVIGRAPVRPFGITWCDAELFVANNRQILVFDAALTYVRTLDTPLFVNTHQLAYRANRIWAASPWSDSLIGVALDPAQTDLEFDLFRQRVIPYVPRPGYERDDVHHINSLLWADGRLFVAAHNLGEPSFILCFDAERMRLAEMYSGAGHAIHGLALRGDDLYWISSRTNEIRSRAGFRFVLPRAGFARGLALGGALLVVAISEHRSRIDRTDGDSWVLVIDLDAACVVAEYALRGTGSINDLRLLDVPDAAHGLPPFWPQPALVTEERRPG